MRVSDVGEFGLIKLLAGELGLEYPPPREAATQRGLLVDLGDDAAVTQRRDGALIWTTDTLVADVHFVAERTSWEAVGWKALAVNLSDIAAMGGTPHLALVTLALPADFCVDDVREVYRGLKQASREYGVTVGGGDIVRAPAFSITVALSGWAILSRLGEPQVMTRSAARVGDIVAVTGPLGNSAGGLRLLQEGAVFDSAEQVALRNAHERPHPRIEVGRAAVQAGVRCAIDISDGLVQDLGHVVGASGAGVRIDAARLPVSEALRELFPSQATGLALTGGEDYELALIGPRPVIERLIEAGGCDLTEVGEVVSSDEPRVVVVDEKGLEIPIGAGGWNHLSR